jgi:serine/threonine protein kinase
MSQKKQDIFWIGDRYCGLFKIGSGGMGEVWAGKALGDRGFERIVAIKRLHFEKRYRESHHRAILDEAAVLQHLSASPNIVSVIDLREEDGQPALIMEYIDGPELSDVLHVLTKKGAALPFPLVAYIVTEVSKGLGHAHACRHPKTGEPLNIVHRDISPSNILFSSAGAVKLTDFGIAKSEIQTTQTMVGEIKGKYKYMAPEQARGLKLDYRTDYFALGLVLYECLFGKPAYEADTDVGSIEKARNGRISYPKTMQPALKRVFNKLLAFDPEHRYAELETFRRDLGEIALEADGIATSDDLATYLRALKIPQLQEAVARRIDLENTRDIPLRDQIAETGSAVFEVPPWYRKRRWQIAIILISAAALLAGYLVIPKDQLSPPSPVLVERKSTGVSAAVSAQVKTGEISIETEPADAIINLSYSKRKFESPSPAVFRDIPFGEKINVSVKKSDYVDAAESFTLSEDIPIIEHRFILTKRPQVKVRFTATPPSTVTIPGRLNGVDAPSPVMTLPAGSYSVVFSNPLATSSANTKLDASAGGSFICSANMQIDIATGTPNGSKPTASCRKN